MFRNKKIEKQIRKTKPEEQQQTLAVVVTHMAPFSNGTLTVGFWLYFGL